MKQWVGRCAVLAEPVSCGPENKTRSNEQQRDNAGAEADGTESVACKEQEAGGEGDGGGDPKAIAEEPLHASSLGSHE